MTSADILKRSFDEVLNVYPADNVVIKCIKNLCDIMLGKELSEGYCEQKSEWLTTEEFCDKYPIIKKSTLRDFVRHSQQPCAWNKEATGVVYILPDEFMKYIRENRKKFFKVHARASRHNFFGLL